MSISAFEKTNPFAESGCSSMRTRFCKTKPIFGHPVLYQGLGGETERGW
jgi:hypothetical protein